jgi:hypothetical protein
MNVPTTVTAEHPVIWRPSPEMPHPLSLEILALTRTERTGLVLDLQITALAPHGPEWWRLAFLDHTAYKEAPVGAPGNEPLARYPHPSPFYTLPGTPFWEIQQSAWLPSCGTRTIEPARLHHYVILAAAQKRAVHVAALKCLAWSLKGVEGLDETLQPLPASVVVEAIPATVQP